MTAPTQPPSPSDVPLLEVRDLRVHFPTPAGMVRAVDGVSFELRPGETLAVVGESGCGKSTIARAIMGIESAQSGELRFRGETLSRKGASHLELCRQLQMIFQDPEASLNPRLTMGGAIAEPMQIHRGLSRSRARPEVEALLQRVGLDVALMDRYPHELSGGQRQRVSIARALAVQPSVLILDEAVSALDVSIQAQILNLLTDLQEEFALTYLFITHDLGVVRHLSHRVLVMYLGEIVELADTQTLFESPRHPYTRALLDSVPRPVANAPRARSALEGDVPSPLSPPTGCRFHTRCPRVSARCRRDTQKLLQLEAHHVRCHLAEPAA